MEIEASLVGGRIRKRGAGTLRLSGPAPQASAIDVVEGTLLVDTVLGASTPVHVYLDGVLGGTGTVRWVVPGATLSPGPTGENPAGTLTTSSLAPDRLVFDLGQPGVAGGPNDLLVVDGSLFLNRVDLVVRPGPGFGLGAYTLIEYFGTLSHFDDPLLIVRDAAFAYHIDRSTAGRVILNVTAVPEPGAAALLAALGPLLRRRR